MTSEENLNTAFAGESMANRKYLAFAEKADKEGYKNVARLFRAASESETIHALNHLEVMKEINSTEENLKSALDGENYEKMTMYPNFIKEAKEEGDTSAERTFEWAIAAEKIHANLYDKALRALKDGKDVEIGEIHICEVCGFTVEGEAPEKCPVCGSVNKFRVVP